MPSFFIRNPLAIHYSTRKGSEVSVRSTGNGGGEERKCSGDSSQSTSQPVSPLPAPSQSRCSGKTSCSTLGGLVNVTPVPGICDGAPRTFDSVVISTGYPLADNLSIPGILPGG